MADPEDTNDPQALAQAQAQQAAQQQEQQLQQRERMAKVGLDEAKQAEVQAKAQSLDITTKQKALDLASLIEALLHLAPAADRLYAGSAPQQTAPTLPAEQANGIPQP